MTFHCLIVGSRGYTDYASFKAKCDALLAGRIDIEIVSGGCEQGHGSELRPGEGVRQSAEGYSNRFMPQFFDFLTFIHVPYRYAVKSSKC